MHLTCEYCGRTFEARKRRRGCSRTCSGKLAAKDKHWPPEADAWIERHAETMPPCKIAKAYNSRARREGWPERTENAISIRLRTLGFSRRCTHDNLTRSEIARQLGIHPDRVRTWTRQGLPWKKAGRNTAIKVKDLRKFLMKSPYRAADIDPDALGWLIGDDAAQAIVACKPSRRGRARPVINLDTGTIYRSTRDASRTVFVDYRSLGSAIRRQGTSAGYRWAYLDEMGVRA